LRQRARAHPRTAAASAAADDVVLLRSEKERHVGVPSRRSVPAIFPVSIVVPEQSGTSSAIWKATPSASVLARAPSQAGMLPRERARLQRAALDVRLDRGRRIVRLRALQRLPRASASGRVGENLHRLHVSRRRKLRERAGKR